MVGLAHDAEDSEKRLRNGEVEVNAAALGLVLLAHLDEYRREAGNMATDGE